MSVDRGVGKNPAMAGRSAFGPRFGPGVAALLTLLTIGALACRKKKEFEIPARVGGAERAERRGPKTAGLAEGRPWKASSALPGFPRSGTVMALPVQDFFCHTEEEEGPWVEIDLGSARQVRTVTVGNRLDCCAERALPLVVEVGTDGGKLVEVARRTLPFGVWSEPIRPQLARYVRIRVAGKSYLHLSLVILE